MTKKNALDSESIKRFSIWGGIIKYFRYPGMWSINCHSVARAVAVGLFAAVIPLMPFQTIIAVVFAFLIRANLPVALLVSCVSNPLTFLPINYLTYYIGNLIAGESGKIHFGKAYLIGLPIVAIGATIAGYCITIIVWYVANIFHLRYKRRK